MKAHPEVYVVCAGALAIGAVLGPMVSAKPAHVGKPKTVEMEAPRNPSLSGGAQAVAPPSSVQVQVASDALPLVANEPPTTAPKSLGAFSSERRLSRSAVLVLANRCAPSEPASVLASIARVESGYHSLMIGVNSPRRSTYEPSSPQEAAVLAARLIASGKNVDLGLAQINSKNLSWLGLSVNEAFDPCRNLAAAAAVMARGYKAALKISPPDRSLLQSAYSLYNTGDVRRGLSNGYVDRVEGRR